MKNQHCCTDTLMPLLREVLRGAAGAAHCCRVLRLLRSAPPAASAARSTYAAGHSI
ncbi:hypothetical protein [Mucilaginibacter koreensis]